MVFWVMTLCRPAGGYRRFGETCCLKALLLSTSVCKGPQLKTQDQNLNIEEERIVEYI
jgi:hypothetical protein